MPTSYFYIIFVTKDYSRTAGLSQWKVYIYNCIYSFSTIFHSKHQAKIISHESTFTLWTNLRILQFDWGKIKTRSTTAVSDLWLHCPKGTLMLKNVTVRRGLLCWLNRDARRSVFNELNILWLSIFLVATVYILWRAQITCQTCSSWKDPTECNSNIIETEISCFAALFIKYRRAVTTLTFGYMFQNCWLLPEILWRMWFIADCLKIHERWKALRLLVTCFRQVLCIIRTSKDVPFSGLLVASCKQTRNNSKSPL